MTDAILYLVATPIGNLGDMTQRAVDVLKSVSFIAAEDTRRTAILCQRFEIRTRLESYHDFSDERKRTRVLEALGEGKSVALVSDGGSPLISDPGFKLVREAIRQGIKVCPIPGPTSVIAALSVSGFPTDRFVFEGFLPVKTGNRKRRLGEIKNEKRTIIYFESPYRLLRTLDDITEALSNRPVCVAKELTKQFEEVYRGTAVEIKQKLSNKAIKGEYVIVVKGMET